MYKPDTPAARRRTEKTWPCKPNTAPLNAVHSLTPFACLLAHTLKKQHNPSSFPSPSLTF